MTHKNFILQIEDYTFITEKIKINSYQCKTVGELKKKVSDDFIIDQNLFDFKEPPETVLKDLKNEYTFTIKMNNPSTVFYILLPDEKTKFQHINSETTKFKDVKDILKKKNLYYSDECIENNFEFTLFGIKIQYKDEFRFPNIPSEAIYKIKLTENIVTLNCYENIFTFSEKESFNDVSTFIKDKFECNKEYVEVEIIRGQEHKSFLQSNDRIQKGDVFRSIKTTINCSFFIGKKTILTNYKFEYRQPMKEIKSTIARNIGHDLSDLTFKYNDPKVEITDKFNDQPIISFYTVNKKCNGIFLDINIKTEGNEEPSENDNNQRKLNYRLVMPGSPTEKNDKKSNFNGKAKGDKNKPKNQVPTPRPPPKTTESIEGKFGPPSPSKAPSKPTEKIEKKTGPPPPKPPDEKKKIATPRPSLTPVSPEPYDLRVYFVFKEIDQNFHLKLRSDMTIKDVESKVHEKIPKVTDKLLIYTNEGCTTPIDSKMTLGDVKMSDVQLKKNILYVETEKNRNKKQETVKKPPTINKKPAEPPKHQKPIDVKPPPEVKKADKPPPKPLTGKKNKYYYQTNLDTSSAIKEIELDSSATIETFKNEIKKIYKVRNIFDIKILFAGKDLLDEINIEKLKIGDTVLEIYIRTPEDILLMTAKALRFDTTLNDDDDDDYYD